MNTIEKSGKTVEDAVEAGLAELKLASSDVDIEVLEYGSPGLFGMFGKLARVRLTVKKHEDDFDFDMSSLSLEKAAPSKPGKPARPQKEEQPKAERPKPERPKQDKPKAAEPAEKPVEPATVKAEPEKSEVKRERPPRPKTARPAKKPAPEVKEAPEKSVIRPPMEMMTMEDLPPLEIDKLSEDGKKAYEFLLNTTKLMGVDVEIRLRQKEEQLQIQMTGDTLGILIGRRGETLDALQYLTSLKVNKGREEYLRVTLDTEHYRAKREEALRRLAERMANRARKTGRRVALEPMNPYERRVLHSALQDNEFVTTHSEGEEPYRKVIITLK